MGIRTIDGEVDCSSYSPSNLAHINYFKKIESDIMLSYFIKIFETNGNEWEMDRVRFLEIIVNDMAIAKKNPGGLRSFLLHTNNFEYVYNCMFNEEGDKLVFRKDALVYLIITSRKPSFINFKKRISRKMDQLLALNPEEKRKVNI